MNIFDYATSELSQDAFLSWLISNFDCEQDDVKEYSRQFLAFLLNKHETYTKDTEIKDVAVWEQWNDIDVVVWGKYDGEGFALAIEDKTFSYLHSSNDGSVKVSQLKKYRDALEKDAQKKHANENLRIYGVVYKTSSVTKEERNDANVNQFSVFDIDDICLLFERIKGSVGLSRNEILIEYQDYLENYQKAKATDNVISDQWNVDAHAIANAAWENYFAKSLLPALDKKDKFVAWFGVYHGTYIYLHIGIKGNEKCLPILEFDPRNLFRLNKKSGKTAVFSCQIELFDLSDKNNRDKWGFQGWNDVLTNNSENYQLYYRANDRILRKQDNRKKKINLLGKITQVFSKKEITKAEFSAAILNCAELLLTLGEQKKI